MRLCREDAKTIESCCSEQVLALATVEVESCKAKPQDPCDGLYGAEGLQCAWQEDAKTCIWVVIKSALQRLVVSENCLIIFFAVQSWITINVLKAMDCYEQWFDILWSTMPYEPVESVEKGLFLRQWWPVESVSIQSDSPIWSMFQPWWLESRLGTSKLSSFTEALRTAARAAVENNANSAVQMLNVSPAVVMTTIIPWTLRRCAKTLDWHDEIWWASKKETEMDHIWTSWDLFDDFLQMFLLKTWLICPSQDSKEEAVTSCFDTKCRGCSGEQCQLCREDAKGECSSVSAWHCKSTFCFDLVRSLPVILWWISMFPVIETSLYHWTMSFWCFCMFDSVGRVIPVTFP